MILRDVLTNKTEQPKNLPIPADLAAWDNFKKLQFLHKAAAIIVDKLVVNKEMMDKTIETMVSALERLEMISQIELNPDGRFPCRFPGCSKSFKYNRNSRKKHELSHDPPVVVPDNNYSTPTSSQVLPCKMMMPCLITTPHYLVKDCSF